MWYVAKTLVGVLSMANAKDEVRRTLIQGDELKERNWKIKDAEIKKIQSEMKWKMVEMWQRE